MGNKTVVLYKRIKQDGKWTFKKVTGPRLLNLREGCYYVSWYEGSKKQMENIGADAALAIKALDKKTAELHFIAAGGQISSAPESSSLDSGPTVLAKIGEYLEDCRDRQGKSGYGLAPRTVEAYTYRLGFLTEFRPGAYPFEGKIGCKESQ